MAEGRDTNSPEDLYESFVEGGAEDFETFLAQYPQDAEGLRELHERREEVARELERSATDESFFKGRSTLGDPETDSSFSGRRTGDVIGDFRLIRLLGRGGMGQVWEAEQVSMGRRMALKLLHTHVQLSEEGVSRFHREAKAGGKLTHPGIVQVHSVGADEGVHFMVQELVEGSYTLADSLADFREETELPEGYYERVGDLFAQMAEALAHAHEHGVVHRDIKPSNILIGPDEKPKVADFGLAMVEDQLGLSRTGDFMGTPFYMSPEQAASKRMGIDHRTDIFSLGATLYEALTLTRAFHGDTSQQIVEQILTIDPQDPQRLRSRVPRDLAVICLKAMEKARDQRYQAMAEFAADLRRFLAHEPILAKRPGPLARASKWRKRHPVISGSIVVLSVFLLVIGAAIADLYFKSKEIERLKGNYRNAGLQTRVRHHAANSTALKIEALLAASAETNEGQGTEGAPGPVIELLEGEKLKNESEDPFLMLCMQVAGPHWPDSTNFDCDGILDLVQEHSPSEYIRSIVYLAYLYYLDGDQAMADHLIQRVSSEYEAEVIVGEIWSPSEHQPFVELIGSLPQEAEPTLERAEEFVGSLPESLTPLVSAREHLSVGDLLERVHGLVYDHHLDESGLEAPRFARSHELAYKWPSSGWGVSSGWLEIDSGDYCIPAPYLPDANFIGWLVPTGWFFERTYNAEAPQSFLFPGDLIRDMTVRFEGYGTLYVNGDLEGVVEFPAGRNSEGTVLVGGRMDGRLSLHGDRGIDVVLRGGLGGELDLEEGRAYIYGLHRATTPGGTEDPAPSWQIRLGDEASAYLVGHTTKADVERITGRGEVLLERSDLPLGVTRVGELTVEVLGE